MALDVMFHKTIPQSFQNPVLYAFANAVWNCPTAAEVGITINEATAGE
jgi:DNA-binding FadR family transcriptional regulator